MDDGEYSDSISAALLQGARERDEDACRRLVENLYPQVISIVRNHLPRTEDEEDLAQMIFMKMFAKLDQYRGRQPFEHWVSRLSLNTCYDRLRHQRARRVISFNELTADETVFLDQALAAEAAQPASETGVELAHGLLNKLLAALKPREQTVVRLLDLEEKSIKEVCDLTGWGASKVKVTAMRARRKLTEMVKRLEGSGAARPGRRAQPTET